MGPKQAYWSACDNNLELKTHKQRRTCKQVERTKIVHSCREYYSENKPMVLCIYKIMI